MPHAQESERYNKPTVLGVDSISINHTHTVFEPQVCMYTQMHTLQYYRLPELTIGGYDFERDGNGTVVPIRIDLRQYREAILNASDDIYILDGRTDESKSAVYLNNCSCYTCWSPTFI